MYICSSFCVTTSPSVPPPSSTHSLSISTPSVPVSSIHVSSPVLHPCLLACLFLLPFVYLPVHVVKSLHQPSTSSTPCIPVSSVNVSPPLFTEESREKRLAHDIIF